MRVRTSKIVYLSRTSLVLCAVLPSIAGCRSADNSAPPPALASVPPGSVSTIGVAEKPLPEIRDFGYLSRKAIKGSDVLLTIQYAELLRGEAAKQAAIEDGLIKEDEDLEDDYYVREGDREIGTFKVDPRAKVFLTDSPEGPLKEIALDKFLTQVGTGKDDRSELANAPYWFTLVGDRITKIEQQFVP